MPRYKLRTLLILLAVLPPSAALIIRDPRTVLDVGFVAAIGAGSVLVQFLFLLLLMATAAGLASVVSTLRQSLTGLQLTPRYKLRTLLLLMAVLPPLLAGAWWCYGQWRAELERRRAMAEMIEESRLGNQRNLRQISLRAIKQKQAAPPGPVQDLDLSYRKFAPSPLIEP